ncbi:RHO1 GDP-GTP exchange protein 2, partial [Coemansia aciculifera]
MATTPLGPAGEGNSSNGSGSGGTRKHRGSPFTSWLKKSNSSEAANSKKLASPAEEIKLVFLRQLELSSVELNGKHYHSVFTGAQIVVSTPLPNIIAIIHGVEQRAGVVGKEAEETLDIILNHFGLPDRKLASNVASRLIDCSLYTHVSGPSSQGEAAGMVIDSNTEIYTLTSDALAALKSLHKGDTLQRAKTHTRRRYMDLRGHMQTRSVDSQGTGSLNQSGDSSSSSSSSSQHASITGLNASTGRSSQALMPPPLDLSRAGKTRFSNMSNSPSDTLVGLGGPATPNNGDALGSSGLREVSIPTGDFAGLLNTWSFLGAANSRHSIHRQPSAALLSGALDGEAGQRISRDLESAELAQRRWALCPTEPALRRRCPSAPSLSSAHSDSDVSYLTAFRDSTNVTHQPGQQQQQQQRVSRDSWYDGSQVSDITAASSYVGVQFRGAAPDRLSVTSSLRPWHPARSSMEPCVGPNEEPTTSTAEPLPSSLYMPEVGPCRDSYDSADSRRQSVQQRQSIEQPARQLLLWRDTVPAALLQSLGQETIAQQEAIHELISTETGYLHDLELIDTVFAEPLLGQSHVMEGVRALGFLHTVFYNYRALIDNSRQLCAQLAERQQQMSNAVVVGGVGDIFDQWADDLQAFVDYSVH